MSKIIHFNSFKDNFLITQAVYKNDFVFVHVPVYVFTDVFCDFCLYSERG